MIEFHNTVMGRRLIEHTLPDIADQLKRIADALEKKQEDETFTDVSELIKTLPNDADLGEKIRELYYGTRKHNA